MQLLLAPGYVPLCANQMLLAISRKGFSGIPVVLDSIRHTVSDHFRDSPLAVQTDGTVPSPDLHD